MISFNYPIYILLNTTDRHESVGLNDVKSKCAVLQPPHGQSNIELVQFYSQSNEQEIQKPLANTLGIRHIAFAVENIEKIVSRLKKKGKEIFSEVQRYEESYKLCYVRGPEGIILELAEKIESIESFT